jgi:hypothetical protein
VRAGLRSAVAIGLCLALAGLAGCGGDDDDARSRVRAYLDSANELQRGAADEFKRAGEDYIAFARGELRPRVAVERLERSESDIRATRDELAVLHPPREAVALHSQLQRVYDMNLELAHETALLAAFERSSDKALAPLERFNRQLGTGLRRADGPEQQARALERFAARLRTLLRELRALEPPLVMRVPHADQIARLESTRSLAVRLRRALQDQDAERVARLLKRFRSGASERRPRRKLARRALTQYERRYSQLNDAYADVYRELARLDKSLR